ncbi:EXS_family protein [Hexamita inflata]|uniref:EXS family protein n=1 Tax=Hexamita inflata TaxID=28002 RepID=A0AA86QIJ7_9EUKA|nr:EXS family protein [Hexamita inflata]CAI9963230.1 EXS family protein [Hexamita inflata]
MTESEINPEWQNRYIQIDPYKTPCKDLEALIDEEKELVKESKTSELIQQAQSNIRLKSKQIIQEMQKDVYMVENFFLTQLKKIQKERDEVVELAKRAFNIKLPKNKCFAIQQKMQECMRKAVMLQNYAVYNQEQLKKIVLLHGVESKNTYDAKQWLEDMMDSTEFDDDNQFQAIFDSLAISFAELMNIGQNKALQLLKSTNKGEEINAARNRVSNTSSFLSGFALLLLINLISFSAYWYDNSMGKLTKIQEMAVRVHFIIATIMVGFGYVMYFFNKFQLNYIFVLQIPGSVIQYGHRNVIKIGAIQMLVVTASSTLCLINQLNKTSQTGLPATIPIVFGQFALKVSQIMKPTYWMLFPTLTLPLFTIVNMVRFRGKRSVFTYAMITLFRMFTPWRQRVEFPHFYFCNLLNSAKDSFKEIIAIIGCNRVPDYILILFVNIFNLTRGVQSFLRWRDSKQFYNQGWNMIKYLISIVSSMLSLEKVKNSKKTDDPTLYWVFTGVKAVECVYKLYWDIFEDWGLLYGGSSGKKFRTDKSKWQYGWYVRRPCNMPLLAVVAAHLVDYTARVIWIVPYFEDVKKYTDSYWYKCLTTEIEIFRRLVWMLIRMDNQQSTNAEGYATVRNIPDLINEQEQDEAKQKAQSEKEASVLNSMSELQSIFNDQHGKEKVDQLCTAYKQLQEILPQKLSNFEDVIITARGLISDKKQPIDFSATTLNAVTELDLDNYASKKAPNQKQREIIDEFAQSTKLNLNKLGKLQVKKVKEQPQIISPEPAIVQETVQQDFIKSNVLGDVEIGTDLKKE